MRDTLFRIVNKQLASQKIAKKRSKGIRFSFIETKQLAYQKVDKKRSKGIRFSFIEAKTIWSKNEFNYWNGELDALKLTFTRGLMWGK